MTGPERHANTVRDAIWRAPGHVHESSLTALDALVALAERAATLERERDEARRSHASWQQLYEEEEKPAAEQARGEADRLREALREIASTDFDEPSDFSELGRIARAALAGPQTEEQT